MGDLMNNMFKVFKEALLQQDTLAAVFSKNEVSYTFLPRLISLYNASCASLFNTLFCCLAFLFKIFIRQGVQNLYSANN